MGKSSQGLLQGAAERHHFEGLAHFAGQEESAGFGGEAGAIRDVGGRVGDQRFDAGAEEEGRLRSKAGDLESGVERSFPDASEIDPRCDVLNGDVSKGIVVRPLFEVAAQRAIGTLWVVVMCARETIVKEEEHAALETLSNACDPRLDVEADFRRVVVREAERKLADQRSASCIESIGLGSANRLNSVGRAVR